ncbi:MAG: SPFH domain-containing protein, partial [Acidimicrobiia bacterium]|nr:SPFH domain-containing protein [Acidimicrobiia bacterium]
MTDIKRYPVLSHLRAEQTSHILRYRKGRLVSSAQGGAFWFRPLTAAIADLPVDDREQSFLFTGRTADFQDVSVQGTVSFRIADAEQAARRIDFGIDVRTGAYLETPLDRLSDMVAQTAQQLALDWIAHRTLDEVLVQAVSDLRLLLA